MDTDKKIWQYFKQHWQNWFPNLGSYPNFAKQCANLYWVKQQMHQKSLQIGVSKQSIMQMPFLLQSVTCLS